MSIGIMLFETAGCRLRGDPGYPGTFDFPVEYGVVEGSYRDLIEGSEEACERLCGAARVLEQKGVRAIAGDCGLMALYQKEIASSVHIPVASSSLVLLPLIRTMTAEGTVIGILTGHSALLGERHLRGAGAANAGPFVIQGMQEEPHFREVVIEGAAPQQYEKMKRDVLDGVERLLQAGKPLGAILLECSNLAVFGTEITRAFHIPVFDINTAVELLQNAWEKRSYRL